MPFLSQRVRSPTALSTASSFLQMTIRLYRGALQVKTPDPSSEHAKVPDLEGLKGAVL